MEVAPSKPCRRSFAAAEADGSYAARPKNSSEEMDFWAPNFWRAYFSESSAGSGILVQAQTCIRVERYTFDGPTRAPKPAHLPRCRGWLRAAYLPEPQPAYPHA